MNIRFLGQSGYEIRTENTRILIDPYLSDSVGRLEGRPRLLPIPMNPQNICCDGVVCTHDHLDHLDPDTVSLMCGEQFFLTTNEGKKHLKQLGKNHVKTLEPGDSITLGDCVLTGVFAHHTVEAFGLVVRAEGKTLYFSGDTLFHEKLFEIKMFKPDVAFLCINGRLGNMNVQEALAVAKEIGAEINIPNHYDMFASNREDPHLFADYITGGRILNFNQDYIF